MKKFSFPKHSLGWTVSAAKAVKESRRKRRLRERAKVWAKIVNQEFEERWNATKREVKTGWFNPLRVILWPAKSTFAVIGFVTKVWFEIIKSGRESKGVKEAALKNLSALLVQEMISDPDYGERIKKLVENKKAVWLTVDESGEVILSKNKTKESIDVSNLIDLAKQKKFEATYLGGNMFPKGKLYIGEKGSNLEVYAPALKKVEIILANDIEKVILTDHPNHPNKKELIVTTNSGNHSFLLEKEIARRIYLAIMKKKP